jgi:hypothetical protein
VSFESDGHCEFKKGVREGKRSTSHQNDPSGLFRFVDCIGHAVVFFFFNYSVLLLLFLSLLFFCSLCRLLDGDSGIDLHLTGKEVVAAN